jgi:hypothetical protein
MMDLACYLCLLSGEPPHSCISHGACYRNHHHKIDLLEMRQSEQLVPVRPGFGGFDGVLPEVGSGEDLRFLQSIRSWVGIG